MPAQITFKLKCECCGKTYDMPRTDEIPLDVNNMACNYCRECEASGKMEDYYEEWPIKEEEISLPENTDQLKLF